MTPEATRRKTGYGWKLGTYRLPSDDYSFEVLSMRDTDDTVELELKVVGGVYNNHRLRAFLPLEEKFYERNFRGRLEADYGLIVPATVQKF